MELLFPNMAKIQNGGRKSCAIYNIKRKWQVLQTVTENQRVNAFFTDSSALMFCFENNVDSQRTVSVALLQINTKYIAF